MASVTPNTDIVIPAEEEFNKVCRQNPIFLNHSNTPLTWLEDRIKQANAECPEKLKVVLLITGSMSPVHKMHLNALKTAGEYLERHCGHHILGGFISPSNDNYVYGKLKDKAIPFVDRVKMCHLAVKELHFGYPVEVDEWEGSIPDFMNFPYVRAHLTIAIQDTFPSEKILVMYVDGIDHFNRCGLFNWFKIATVLRPPNTTTAVSDPSRHVYVCTDSAGEDVSSTEVRKRVEAGESIDDLTFPSVAAYIKEYYAAKGK